MSQPPFQQILDAFNSFKELTKGELKQITKITDSQILNEAISELLKHGKIKIVKQGVYALDKTNFIDPKQTSLF
jgi:ribonuclease HI